eukprot:g2657.t1
MFWQLAGLAIAFVLCVPAIGFEGGWVTVPVLAALGLLCNILRLLGQNLWGVVQIGDMSQQVQVQQKHTEMTAMVPAELDAGQQVQITVPPGMGPGQQLRVTNPYVDGKMLTVTIPANVGEGQCFLVTKAAVQAL